MVVHAAPEPDDNLALPPGVSPALVNLLHRASRRLERFLRIEAASGILPLLSAAVVLLWANSPWGDAYFHLWHTPVGLPLGHFAFERPLEWYVNDGGMVAPALIYLAVAGVPATKAGWGVPMTTDIAFAVGILTPVDEALEPRH